jgi:glutamate-5-semialdehyde dehydrogenase
MRTTREILERAVKAKGLLTGTTTEQKNTALQKMAGRLLKESKAILSANARDVENARGKMSDVMLDRLQLDEKRIGGMAKGMTDLIPLPDPVGEILYRETRPNGMVIEKTSVPMGVVAIIYESRPNVTSDAAALALKSGNVCVLRSGKEAWQSANAIVTALQKGAVEAGLPSDCVQLIEDVSRESATELMTANGYVDLLIPRGGAGLISACVKNATVPCIQTGTGICHVYVDKAADIEKALNIIENAKTSRPSVCNAEEVCLVDQAIAPRFLPLLKKRLTDDRAAAGKIPVELRLDERAAKIIQGVTASATDFDTEFLDYILAVGVVDGVEEAVKHIALHSTHHSEAIVTEDEETAKIFTRAVDSAAVYVNVSTRFTDGGEFGLGCEMGISTQKLHARGPMGLKELCTYKYIIRGNGQVR